MIKYKLHRDMFIYKARRLEEKIKKVQEHCEHQFVLTLENSRLEEFHGFFYKVKHFACSRCGVSIEKHGL